MRYIMAQNVAARHVFAIKKDLRENTEVKILIEIEFSHARTKLAEQQAYICVPLGGKPYGILQLYCSN
jgi:hypothetical protein